jgi:four helix bundle protein
MKYKDFTEMPIWNTAINIADLVFKITDNLPRKEDYGLTSQLRRSSVSISSNIAEGYGRNGERDKIKFYIYARGSAFETKSQLLYGVKVNYFKAEETTPIIKLVDEIILDINKINKTLKSNV